MNPNSGSLRSEYTHWSVTQTHNPVARMNSFKNFGTSEYVPYRSLDKMSNVLYNSTFADKETKCQSHSIEEMKCQSFSLPPITTFTDPSSLCVLGRGEGIFIPTSSYHIAPKETTQNNDISTWEYSANFKSHARNYPGNQVGPIYDIFPLDNSHKQINFVGRMGLITPESIAKPSNTLMENYPRIWGDQKRGKPKKYAKPAIIMHKRCRFCGKFFAQSASLKAHPSIPASHSSCKCLKPNNKNICKRLKATVWS